MDESTTDRDELAAEYLETLDFEPYPVQEEALLSWFTADQGVLVCAPTGTGKTLIAQAALYEALRTGQRAYYTTPLIALTDQKFYEMQEKAVEWGFHEDDIGLVTGNRRVNPEAPVLIVVAEILLNRLLHPASFDFDSVQSVVMDEFHSFNDYDRGIVWELSLSLLPEHVRTLLLSATVGNSFEFVRWLDRNHDRRLELVESSDRKVPLTYQWVGDELLSEFIERTATGTDEERKSPALVFCFNRDWCWTIAEQLKGKKLLGADQQRALLARLDEYDWSTGAGSKLRQLLQRGVGVHHAGLMPKYRRAVEDLFQRKLLSICVCTETLAAGINLPARSVVMPTILKGPPGKRKIIEASSAHQMFGRAGRPQFDTEGFIFAMAHEDDVKLERWRAKYDQIPEDTKDPGLRKAKKALKKKMPKRRTTEQYWSEAQFNQLQKAGAADLYSKGDIPWRVLAWMLDASPEVERLKTLVSKRLQSPKDLQQGQQRLLQYLKTLHDFGFVELDPPPPAPTEAEEDVPSAEQQKAAELGRLIQGDSAKTEIKQEPPSYWPTHARPTAAIEKLLMFRSVNPIYAMFLLEQLGAADRTERLQAWESILEVPGSVARHVRVPRQDELPPGPLATTKLDAQLLQMGLVVPEQLVPLTEEEREEKRNQMFDDDEPIWVLTLAEKLIILFRELYPGAGSIPVTPVWIAGELLNYGGDFDKFVTSNRLQKQEGVIFRHLLRLVLLLGEFSYVAPQDVDPQEWRDELHDIARQLTDSCRQVDASSTDKMLEEAEAAEKLRNHGIL